MASYKIGAVIRILAGVVSMPFLWLGLSLLSSVLSELHWPPIVFGLVATAVGGVFIAIAFSGRVPTWAEEYGLDDPSEVDALREDMTRKGRFTQ